MPQPIRLLCPGLPKHEAPESLITKDHVLFTYHKQKNTNLPKFHFQLMDAKIKKRAKID